MIIDDKLMKYVIFKKRTENEIRQKCNQLKYTSDYIEEIIEYLKESGYINDKVYVEKYVNNVIKLKTSSIYEMKIGMLRKGVDEDLIEQYISSNYEELLEFEQDSAIKVVQKKRFESIDKLRRYMKLKGYLNSSINHAIDNSEDLTDNY